MKISYNKLQTFFDTSLPEPAVLAEAIIFHAFEVESLEPSGDDTIMEIKILPDRAHDCSSEVGIAREVGVILNITLKLEIVAGFNTESSVNLSVPYNLINERLGVIVPKDEVLDILTSLQLSPIFSGEDIVCNIPKSRPDITLPEHLIKEVGRIYGYDKVQAVVPPPASKAPDAQTFLQSQTVRESLLPLGFSEVYGYSFTKEGVLAVLKPLQQDKPFLRTGLTEALSEKIDLNVKHSLFDSEVIKIFEIGTVFPVSGEELRVAIGVGYSKKKFNQAAEEFKKVMDVLGIADVGRTGTETTSVIEFPLSAVQAKTAADLSTYLHMDTKYQKFSSFPRIVRDVALFVPEGTDPQQVALVMKENGGELLVRGPVLFDEFHKDGKVSLAFRLVFQAFDRTLSDEEVNKITQIVVLALEQKNWEVRK